LIIRNSFMTFPSRLPRLNALWVSGSLSYIEQLCLTSALQAGHEVTLYTYYDVLNVPNGVDVRDAREIMPEDQLIKYDKKGKISYALGSDIFRYSLMQQSKGYWIDTDVYILKPLVFEQDIVLGWQYENSVNGAVLYIKQNTLLLRKLMEHVTSYPCIPPWWSIRNKGSQKLKALFGVPKPVERMKWGVYGPHAITYFVKELQLENQIMSQDIFYPNPWQNSKDIFFAGFDISSCVTSNTKAIHLWNENIKEFKKLPPAPNSFLDKACQKHGINYLENLAITET
ncbi:MAG: hypothetical protein AAF228_05660, partial [Pseudomonadota bacterium]